METKARSAFVRWGRRILIALVLLALLALFPVRKHVWNHFVAYPRQAAAWETIRADHHPVALDDGYYDLRGVCHSHSKFSHDSEMPFEKILEAAHKAEIKFLFMSDHVIDTKADFSWQWRGEKEGVFFFPGFEMSAGYLVWGLPEETVLTDRMDPKLLAKQIYEKGGIVYYAHSENKHDWEQEFYGGMEIYNIHTDFLDEALPNMLLNMFINERRHGDQALRSVFKSRPDLPVIHARWDELNKTRKIVGIAAVDAHQNVGARLYYTEDGNLLIRDTGPKPGKIINLNFLSRGLLRVLFGPLEPGKQLYRRDFDPYDRSLRYVNNHLLVRETSEEALFDALKQGRSYIAFNIIADATGFTFLAESGGGRPVPGEGAMFTPGAQLRGASPYPARFTVRRDGEIVHTAEGRDFTWEAPGPGKYRLEAELNEGGTWTPWVYTNPIQLYAETPPAPLEAPAAAPAAVVVE